MSFIDGMNEETTKFPVRLTVAWVALEACLEFQMQETRNSQQGKKKDSAQ